MSDYQKVFSNTEFQFCVQLCNVHALYLSKIWPISGRENKTSVTETVDSGSISDNLN